MDKLAELAKKYFRESFNYLVTDEQPDILLRGTGTIYSGALLCVNIETPAGILMPATRNACLKFLHICLGLLRDIAAEMGARIDWTEINSSGMVAYFVDHGYSNNVWQAILSAIYVRACIEKLVPEISPVLGTLDMSASSSIHHAPFLVAEIGPRTGSLPGPVGAPLSMLHRMHEETPGSGIIVSDSALGQLDLDEIFGKILRLKAANYRKALFRPIASLKAKGEIHKIFRFNEKNFEKLLSSVQA